LGLGGGPGSNTLVQGAGGFGKTVLAIDACHRPEVVSAFPDGILWATLGENPDLAGQLGNLYGSVAGSSFAVSGADAIGNELGKMLQGRRCLIAIDDVWRTDDLSHFLKLDGQRLLVTTRVRNLIEIGGEIGWREVQVDEMESGEASSLLMRGIPPEDTIQRTL